MRMPTQGSVTSTPARLRGLRHSCFQVFVIQSNVYISLSSIFFRMRSILWHSCQLSKRCSHQVPDYILGLPDLRRVIDPLFLHIYATSPSLIDPA